MSTAQVENSMSEGQAEILHEYMRKFERDPKQTENAHTLFRELNKYGLHTTVLRLYFKHEMSMQTSQASYDNMQAQFEYARDHVE
jgi:hypothetical protein